MEEDFFEGMFALGRVVVGIGLQLGGGFVEMAADGVAEITATVLEDFTGGSTPVSEFIRDKGKTPFELIGHGMGELGKQLTEE